MSTAEVLLEQKGYKDFDPDAGTYKNPDNETIKAEDKSKLDSYATPDYEVQEDDEEKKEEKKDTAIYQKPTRENSSASAEESLDDIITGAENFISSGNINYNETNLQMFSKSIYNVAVAIGVAAAVVVGGIIGIKFMLESAEGKAEVKKLLVPYIAGCIIIFGGFTIWKIVVDILQGI